MEEFAMPHGDGVADEPYPIAVDLHPNDATSGGGLAHPAAI